MKQTDSKLLTVEDTFLVEGRGIIVAPKIPIESYGGQRSRVVTLRTPDGGERKASATLDVPFVSPPPLADYYLCLLAGLTEADVPIGTEIWLDESP